MMYETHTVQTGSYKFAWLVDWWEAGLVGGDGGVSSQKKAKKLLYTFCLFQGSFLKDVQKCASKNSAFSLGFRDNFFYYYF